MVVHTFLESGLTHTYVDLVVFVAVVVVVAAAAVAGDSGCIYNVGSQAFAIEWARLVAWAIAGSVRLVLYVGDLFDV